MIKSLLLLGICIFEFATPAHAQRPPVREGGLTCETRPRVGLLIGSRQRMNCVFRANAGQLYRYRGRISPLGLDVGATAAGRLFWIVFARPSHIGPGALQGAFV